MRSPRECPPTDRGKTLLFAARDDHADILVEELRAALTEEYGPQPHDLVEKITGSVDKPLDRIKAFKNDPRPKYVVTVDLLTTGIDVPAITNLVFVRRVNSRILYDQMIGRATRRCDEIGKEYFRIFDAVDIYANLQDVTDMRPVVVDPALSFATLVGDLERARDRRGSRLRPRPDRGQAAPADQAHRREAARDAGNGARTAGRPGRQAEDCAGRGDALRCSSQHPSLAHQFSMPPILPAERDGVYISEHRGRAGLGRGRFRRQGQSRPTISRASRPSCAPT